MSPLVLAMCPLKESGIHAQGIFLYHTKGKKRSFVAKWMEHKIKFKNDLEEKSL